MTDIAKPKKVIRKRFQVTINYNGNVPEIKSLTTIELYKLITLFNNSDGIASITLVKIDRR